MSRRTLSQYFIRVVVSTATVATIAALSSAVPSAQPRDRRTTVTFSAPVEIPGVGAQVLPAGTYVFKLLDTISDRHIVQIFNKEENHVYATIMTIPNSRLKATDETVMTFAERRAGDPQAIRAWFYPGDKWGQEFVYPKTRAVALAASTQSTVLYMPDEVAPALIAPVKTKTDAPVVALKDAPVRAVTPAGTDVPVTTVVSPPPVSPAMLPEPLPKTAGIVPLWLLIGVLGLGAGISVRTLCAR